LEALGVFGIGERLRWVRGGLGLLKAALKKKGESDGEDAEHSRNDRRSVERSSSEG
jgi:hypothetical protein